MPITNESKDQLKDSVDIVDVVGDYIELKKNGANFKANCPFHGEKTPSFVVSPSKQIYHCFGCGVGGDVFKFVMELEKLSFTEALEKVADRHNFTLQYTNDHGERKDYGRVMDAMVHYYVKQLREEDRKYLAGRGLSAKTVKEWQIGWAPGTRTQLKEIDGMLLSHDELIDTGMVALDGTRKYARFSERIMIPIHSHTGKVVGFAGRYLKSDDRAKYLNSPQTKLFDKSRILFGYDKAKEAIYKKKFVIVMEGQLDVILCHQAGIQTAVGTQGTALTEQHLSLLSKPGAKVILGFDGDKAGRAAAYKAAVLLSTKGFAGGVVIFGEGEDPADMVAKGKVEKLKAMLQKWTDLVRFVLHTIVSGYRLDDAYQKSEAAKACSEYLNSLGNDIVAQEYASVAASMVGVGLEHIATKNAHVPGHVTIQGSQATAEDLLLYTMYHERVKVDTAIDMVDDEAWHYQVLYRALLENREDESLYAPMLLKDGLVMLDDRQFFEVLRVKQKSYLQEVKMKLQLSGAGIDEILAVNDRMKGL